MLAAVNANSWRASSARKFSIRSEEVTPLKEALIALTDALAKRPTEEILFQWFRSARLVGELSDLMKHRQGHRLPQEAMWGHGRHQIHPSGTGGPKPHGNRLSFTGTDGNRDFNEPTSRDLF